MARPSVWLGRICSRLAVTLRRWFSCCLLLTDGINGSIYRSAQANKQISGSLWMWGSHCEWRMERRKLLLGFIIPAFLLLSIPYLAQRRRVGGLCSFLSLVWEHRESEEGACKIVQQECFTRFQLQATWLTSVKRGNQFPLMTCLFGCDASISTHSSLVHRAIGEILCWNCTAQWNALPCILKLCSMLSMRVVFLERYSDSDWQTQLLSIG